MGSSERGEAATGLTWALHPLSNLGPAKGLRPLLSLLLGALLHCEKRHAADPYVCWFPFSSHFTIPVRWKQPTDHAHHLKPDPRTSTRSSGADNKQLHFVQLFSTDT